MHIKRLHFPVLDSTNSYAKQVLEKLNKNELTLITASHQTAGRGRYKRKWVSEPNQNIYATFVFFFDGTQEKIRNLPQILALAALEVLLKSASLKIEIKWPNDLVAGGKKIGGILSETSIDGDLVTVIIGIGINVNMPEAGLQKIDKPATSLLYETGQNFELEPLLEKLSEIFNEYLESFLANGFAPFYERFASSLCHKLNERISFSDQNQIWSGFFQKVNPDGSLTLMLDSGTTRTFFSGEIM